MNVMLWAAIGVMGLITATLVFELILVHGRHEHHSGAQPRSGPTPRARPTPQPGRRRDEPHAGWFT